jgi:hypothetical protein
MAIEFCVIPQGESAGLVNERLCALLASRGDSVDGRERVVRVSPQAYLQGIALSREELEMLVGQLHREMIPAPAVYSRREDGDFRPHLYGRSARAVLGAIRARALRRPPAVG